MANKEAKEKAIEVTLWDAANKLRGSVEPAEYKHVVLGLIFLKFASDKFENHRAKLMAEGKEKYIEIADFYNMSNVFFLEENSRWSYLIKKSKQNDIALLIDTALHTIEKNNKALKGALPDNYFSRLGLDVTKLASLLDTINDIDTTKDPKQDVVGKVYEYFLSKFALAEGKGKGEFYTPKSIVNLIAEMIEPYKGIIYDPACGSGGMFVQSVKFIEAHHGNKKEVSIYGQEYTNTTYKIQSPKQNMNISEAEGLEELETLQVTEKPEKEDLVMKSSVANASGKLLATVIDTSLPAALGFLAKEEGSGYKADEEDRAELEKALGEYMKLKGGDIPPGMMVLVLVLSIYGAKIPMAIQHRKMNVERLELEQQKKDLEARERALAERLRIADSKKDDTP